MSYRVVYATSFKRSIKRLEKRFRHIRDDVHVALQELLQNPTIAPIIPGGSGTRKYRLRNTDLQKGKSGGYRLIYYLENQPAPIIFLLLIYAKSDQADVTCYELKQLLNDLAREMGGVE